MRKRVAFEHGPLYLVPTSWYDFWSRNHKSPSFLFGIPNREKGRIPEIQSCIDSSVFRLKRSKSGDFDFFDWQIRCMATWLLRGSTGSGDFEFLTSHLFPVRRVETFSTSFVPGIWLICRNKSSFSINQQSGTCFWIVSRSSPSFNYCSFRQNFPKNAAPTEQEN